MSAWLCSDAQISAVVQGMIQYGIISIDEAQATGQMLVDENYASLHARYNDPDTPHQFVSSFIEAPLDALKVHMTTRSYSYQACEHDAWVGSAAERLTTQLTDLIDQQFDGQAAEYWDTVDTWAIENITECLP